MNVQLLSLLAGETLKKMHLWTRNKIIRDKMEMEDKETHLCRPIHGTGKTME